MRLRRSEAWHISYSFYFLCLLLAILALLDFAQPVLTHFGLSTVLYSFSRQSFGQIWPYFSLLLTLILLLLGSRFPTRRKSLHSAYMLSLLCFLLIFESFGLFPQHPLFSFVRIWNFATQLLLGQAYRSDLVLQDFLPLILFAFWGPAFLILILPAERFPFVHWLACFNLLAFSIMHIVASIFLQSYTAGLISSILILPLAITHIANLSRQTWFWQNISHTLLALFYVLILILLVCTLNSDLFFRSVLQRQWYSLYLVPQNDLLINDFLEMKLLNYTIFFLWFSFPLLFLFLFPNNQS